VQGEHWIARNLYHNTPLRRTVLTVLQITDKTTHRDERSMTAVVRPGSCHCNEMLKRNLWTLIGITGSYQTLRNVPNNSELVSRSKERNTFDIHGSVHRRWLSRNTNKMQLCNRIYYAKVYWRLNMFRAAHRSSSEALNCVCSLWFIYPCGDRPLPSLIGKWISYVDC
jgi:hypothetical protein